MGSKISVAKELVSIIQPYVDKGCEGYLEPFCGGLNVMQHVEHPNKIASDNNCYLIGLWQYLLNGGEYPDYISKEEFTFVKNNKEQFPAWYVGFCGVLAGYRGVFLRGYANDCKNRIRATTRQLPFLNNINLESCDYKAHSDKKGFVIYCDPPYSGVDGYRKNCKINHNEFWQWCRDMSKNNIVLISELSAPDDFECIWQKEFQSTMAIKSRKIRVEKLFKLK
jgi:DNA adenine methylase